MYSLILYVFINSSEKLQFYVYNSINLIIYLAKLLKIIVYMLYNILNYSILLCKIHFRTFDVIISIKFKYIL